ncbi:MAG: hypothetical protein D6725_11045 [Planctomycetota bacterium]|nr:MAG: hypothetical protein D6725_11045 [Planctomycetota bacterium]
MQGTADFAPRCAHRRQRGARHRASACAVAVEHCREDRAARTRPAAPQSPPCPPQTQRFPPHAPRPPVAPRPWIRRTFTPCAAGHRTNAAT